MKGELMSEKTKLLSEALNKYVRSSTQPVAVKLAKTGENIEQKAKHPLKDIGNRLSACQGMTIARTIGWTLVFGKEDHACPLGSVFLGHIKPDMLLEGKISGFYQDEDECAKIMEASVPRWPVDSILETWLAPLGRCEFTPDVVVVYGNPAQILTLIQAGNFREGPGIKSSSGGRGGCSVWMAGVIQADECSYSIPGSGERIFAGTQDHEMSFAIPDSKFENVIAGLEYIGAKGSYKYPVPNLAILSEPKFPRDYYRLDPQWRNDRQ
jgi:uncharacterized protein (DUF169 family)